jgi:membrane protease subunit HflC
MKSKWINMVVGALLLAIFFAVLFIFQVRKGEVAVVTTFGKATRFEGPGAHFKLPWPFQDVYKFDQRIHSLESKFEQVQTADGYNLLVMTYIGWNIEDPRSFYITIGSSIAKAEETLESLLRNAYSGVIGRHNLSDLITSDPSKSKFTQIEEEILAKLRSDLQSSTNNYGIAVKFLGIKKLGLPESVTEAVFERMRSERQVLVSKIQSEGERQASEIRSSADTESAKILADADAQALRIRSMGELEAAKTYAEFKQEPELANFLLSLDALESFLKEKTVLFLDTQTAPLTLMKNPLGSTNSLGLTNFIFKNNLRTP